MSQDLDNALRFFFGTFLSEAQRTTLRGAGDRAKVRIGSYIRYEGEPITVIGEERRSPRYAIGVGPVLTVGADGVPAAGTAAAAADANRVYLLWLRDVADVAQDSAEEIERVMANIDFYSTESGSRNAAAWAQAIAGSADRAALTRNFFEHTEVPAAFRELAGSLGDFRETLYHFFTFTESGDYYQRWTGAGRQVPGDLTPVYRERNVVELQLKRYEEYVYSILPARFLDPAGEPGAFREVVWGFRKGEDGRPTEMRVLHTVPRSFANAGDFYDFVAFEADEGEGAEMPVTARPTIDARIADFLQSLPAEGEERSVALRDSNITTDDERPLVKMFAKVDPGFTPPEGVQSLGEGDARVLLVPPELVTEIAARDDVHSLDAPKPMLPRLADVRPMVNLPALETRIPAAKRGGAGTVVGIIDSGIDAQHPGFAGRVLGMWDQFDNTGPNPATNFNPGGVAGTVLAPALNFFWGYGTEHTGATVGNARDRGAHGTHVAGIAAGAAVGGANPVPAGMAPQANIVAVQRGRARTEPNNEFSIIDPAISDWDVYTGIAYVMEKARRLREGTPVVVNMSFGHHDHAHDGTAALSRSLASVAKEGGNFRPGFAMVAAAGNERTDKRHIQRVVSASSSQDFDFDLTGLDSRIPYTEVITIWVTNPTPATLNNLALDVTTRDPASAPAVTPTYSQRADHSPDWVSFWASGVHVGTSFGPRDPENKDFNIRIRLQTARALIPDPAGPVVLAGNPFRLVRVDRDWKINGTATDVRGVANAIIVPLGRSTPPAGASPALTTAFALLAALTTTRWRVTLRNRTTGPLEYHVWAGRENAQFAGVTPADVSHLICTPADSDGVISVASCNANLAVPNPPGASITADGNPEGAISTFSSPGPLRKKPGNAGIDITAPGNMIVSARSARDVAGGNSLMSVNTNARRMAGTSMASPAVAGLIANAMADEPTLRLDQLRARFAACRIPTKLRDGTTAMPAGAPVSANDWGAGLIDANKLKP
jgi:subtilisin family serine protease